CSADAITTEQITDLERHNQQLRDALELGDGEQVAIAEFQFHRAHNLVAAGGKLAWFLLSATRYTPSQLYATDPEWGKVA
ncbi:FCD domain-containing protein, partial [Streptomyces sp. SID10244]|nr:FCD domain-containing protein [Streptomyces sp. SID10244]